MTTKDDRDPEARIAEWLAIVLVLIIIIYKMIVPGPTATLPITSWQETVSNRGLLVGFAGICASFLIIGLSVGYHGLHWHITKAPPEYRMVMLSVSLPPTWIMLWMQQRFHFISGRVHFGLTSACMILGILIGTAIESIKSHKKQPGLSRLELTIMNISIAVIGGFWGAVVATKSKFLRFEVPIQHHAIWSVSIMGILVGWAISALLERRRKYTRITIGIVSGIAAAHLLTLPASSILGLSHEIALSLFGMPVVVIALLTGIKAGVSMPPTPSSQ
jgi:hypothetical protein